MRTSTRVAATAALMCALLGAALPTISRAQGAAPSPAAAAGGPYTAAQAAQGATLFAAQCSVCHGAQLEGIAGPALAGNEFMSKWSGQTAGDLYDVASTQMPLTSPGSLKPDEYLALISYILQKNKYPAGAKPLTAATLKAVVLKAQ
jgi:mono/diheme cytochrome c family protein